MYKGKVLGINKKGQISYKRNDAKIREVKTEDLNKTAKSIIDKIEQILATTEVSNTSLYNVLKFFHIPKPKGEDKNHQMKLITVSYINNILDEVENMVKKYPNIKRKILFRIDILNKIDKLFVVESILTKENIFIL